MASSHKEKVEETAALSPSPELKAAVKAAKLASPPLLTIVVSALGSTILTLKTHSRQNARALTMLAKENDLNCDVTAEVKVRTVKFKGI